MNPRPSAISLFAFTLAVAVPVAALQAQATQTQAQQGPAQAKPEPKPEAKTEGAPTVAGKWNMNVESPNGSMQSGLEIAIDPKDAKKVTGMLSSQMGEAPLEGEIAADGKLTFWLTLNAGGNNMAITFVGTIQKDGSLAGTLDFGQGEIPWTATRVKG
jgi:hypothetical protein